MSSIEVRGLTKCFGSTSVLDGVDLTVADGSITAVLGASGSGKTTLLRVLAGFEHADAGSVSIGGEVVDDGSHWVRAQHRGVGYVPQEGALFPHLTVAANVAFGVARADRARVGPLIELVGLAGLERRYPHQLSGGQQQRVALARALAIQPKVVLLDEPFSSLDATLRESVRRDVTHILATTGTTTVLVTHDQDEALALADQIAVLRDGRMVVTADPRTLYAHPPDLDAAESIGEANVLDATRHGDMVTCVLGEVPVQADGDASVDGACRVLLRPEQISLVGESRPGARPATVGEVQYFGHDALAQVQLAGDDGPALLARVPGVIEVRPGQAVWVEVVGRGRAWPPAEAAGEPAEG